MQELTHELIEELTKKFLANGGKVLMLPSDPKLADPPHPIQWQTDGLNRIEWIYVTEIIEEIRRREKTN
ncbi:MAG: hypothetical protein JRH08_05960 [Deltaproteobacteria bacterium]|nr:hypothetical protein [Deltaproteobacteria bacterium]MBW2026209.1 hypothetical protein [Deltaproteobacteria bacterium]MBW2125240.1 hypothetical protein [Deltaproteobacteria bacterium]